MVDKRKGISLILTAGMLVVLVPVIGLAIDASLLYVTKAKLQTAVDAGALAGARALHRGMDLSTQAANAETTAKAFFAANFPDGYLATKSRVVTAAVEESAYRTRTVSLDARVNAPVWFLRILGFESTTVRAEGMASRRDVNLVLVLDRSSSMSGAMGPMRAAAREFVDRFAEGRDNVGLIVFGGSAIVAFPNPSPSGPQADFKSASPNIDTLISQTVNGSNTGTAEALWLAYQEIVKLNQPGALNLIVFFSDGLPNGLTGEFNDPDPAKNLLKETSGCTYRLQAGRPMIGFLSQKSNFNPTGTTAGIKRMNASTVGSLVEGPIQTDSNGCAYRSQENNMRQDVRSMPPRDYYGNSTTGYVSVDLNRVDSPQQIGYASLNAADNTVQRIRQDASLSVVIYGIGYHGGAEAPDEAWMRRISNDPASPDFDPSKPAGLYVKAPTTSDLANAFSKVASEILRLAL
jgi:Flp pilus assembly protein TadG